MFVYRFISVETLYYIQLSRFNAFRLFSIVLVSVMSEYVDNKYINNKLIFTIEEDIPAKVRKCWMCFRVIYFYFLKCNMLPIRKFKCSFTVINHSTLCYRQDIVFSNRISGKSLSCGSMDDVYCLLLRRLLKYGLVAEKMIMRVLLIITC